jgi:Mn-dependent DtxR family transcriptional regulator
MKRRAVSISREDYLERIDELIDRKGYARVSDIAAELGLGRSSVTLMVQQLSRDEYVHYEKYRGITLTARGRKVARGIRARHQLLVELFEQLGLDVKRVAGDIEGIEHHVSAPTLRQLNRLVKHLRVHPLESGGP